MNQNKLKLFCLYKPLCLYNLAGEFGNFITLEKKKSKNTWILLELKYCDLLNTDLLHGYPLYATAHFYCLQTHNYQYNPSAVVTT